VLLSSLALVTRHARDILLHGMALRIGTGGRQANYRARQSRTSEVACARDLRIAQQVVLPARVPAS